MRHASLRRVHMILKRLSQLALFAILLVSNLSVAEALIAPSGFTAAPYSSSSIVLRWVSASQGNVIYVVERSPSATGPFVAFGSTGWSSTAYLDERLAGGGTYSNRDRV